TSSPAAPARAPRPRPSASPSAARVSRSRSTSRRPSSRGGSLAEATAAHPPRYVLVYFRPGERLIHDLCWRSLPYPRDSAARAVCAMYRSERFAAKLGRHGGHMAVRQVLVSCRYCQRPVALEATIGNQALPRLQAPLVAC